MLSLANGFGASLTSELASLEMQKVAVAETNIGGVWQQP